MRKLITSIAPFICLLFILNAAINALRLMPESLTTVIYINAAQADIVDDTPIINPVSLPYIEIASQDHSSSKDLTFIPIERKIKQTFPNNFPIMLAIAKAESALNSFATNTDNSDGSVDVGIFQINSIHKYSGDLTDVDYNLQCAREVFNREGVGAWNAYNNGKYKDFL